ncbi:DUF551 domain-containing protein [Klebsiella pneumoniae]|uniref:DUF551 domain-containing protein n=1 Tax=Klebsiella pneumoniae TaxID=573 RepID=UPI0038904ED6
MSITRERLLEIIVTGPEASGAEQNELARMALAVMDSEHKRNPVLAYADSYRDMAKQGVESVPIWRVITDIERNIAPLYRHVQPAKTVQPVMFIDGDISSEDADKLAKVIRELHEKDERPLAKMARIIRENPHPTNECDMPKAQPAPVVPDEIKHRIGGLDWGWEGEFNRGWNACRAAMLAASPQSPGGDHATVPGKWIPLSEQMPPSRHEVLVGRWWGEKPRWCCKWATYIPGHPDAQGSGWLIPGASWTPTHWMPLPAAPQEPKP